MVKFNNIDVKKITKIIPDGNKFKIKLRDRKRTITIKKEQTNLLRKLTNKLVLKKKVTRLDKKDFAKQFKTKPLKVLGHREKGNNMFITYINKDRDVIKTKLNWKKNEKIIKRVLKKKLIKRRILTNKLKSGINQVINKPGSIKIDISNKRNVPIYKYILDNSFPESKLIYTINYGDNKYTLNEKSVSLIQRVLKDGVEVLEEIQGSNPDMLQASFKFNDITFSSRKRVEKRKENGGGFFKYITKDLHKKEWERYGIYNIVNADDSDLNCFIKGIKEHGNVSNEIIESLKLKCKNMKISIKDVKKIANQYDMYIEIKNIKDVDSVCRTNKIGKKNAKNKFILGCVDEHFFIYDKKTNITKYAINNYDEIKNLENYENIKGKNKKGKYIRSRKHYISSLDLFRTLLKNKDRLLKPLSWSDVNLRLSHFYNKFDKIETLKYIVSDIKKHKKKDYTSNKNDKSNRRKIFFDVETITNKKHIVHTLCWYDLKDNKHFGVTGKNNECIFKFLESLKGGELLLAHNLGYEFRFLFKFLFNIKFIARGKMVMSASGSYKKRNGKIIDLHFKDTLCLIPQGLAKFPKMFDLKGIKKEIMPYNLYTQNNVTKACVKISEALCYIKKDDHKEFLSNIEEWGLKVENECFKHMEYSKIYCQMDCYITAMGYDTFKAWVNELCDSANEKFYKNKKNNMKNINVDNVISAASLAFKFFDHTDSYKGCYKLAGIPREFIQKCVVGGRTMTRDNKKWKTTGLLDDFDACSLYPSAIRRLNGFLKGCPKIIKNLSYNSIKNHDGYFVEVNILNCPKKLHFPLLNKKNDQGIRNFRNDIRGSIHVDKIGLEDLIKFHEMVPERDFKIIKGYYFNEGRNFKSAKIIKFLYDERVKLKSVGNPAQAIYKLIMNSSYGKTIMKPINEEIHIHNKERAQIFSSRNHNKVKEIINVGDKQIIKCHKTISDHYSFPHIGSEILSMSKRIMNEVICLAEDLKIKIFYQDTDSMHIEQSKVKLLADKFYDKYKKVLIGKKMGQFHGDFDFKCDKGHSPVAVESWFLGKKMYLDKIKCVNNGKVSYKYHARLKGIPSYCIDDKETIYNKLLNNKIHEFNICDAANKLNMPLFDFTKDFNIYKNIKLKRRVKAFGNYKTVEI